VVIREGSQALGKIVREAFRRQVGKQVRHAATSSSSAVGSKSRTTVLPFATIGAPTSSALSRRELATPKLPRSSLIGTSGAAMCAPRRVFLPVQRPFRFRLMRSSPTGHLRCIAANRAFRQSSSDGGGPDLTIGVLYVYYSNIDHWRLEQHRSPDRILCP
jgi:hypothetical protein